MWENTIPSTELHRDFCAAIDPLQLGIVLVFILIWKLLFKFLYVRFHSSPNWDYRKYMNTAENYFWTIWQKCHTNKTREHKVTCRLTASSHVRDWEWQKTVCIVCVWYLATCLGQVKLLAVKVFDCAKWAMSTSKWIFRISHIRDTSNIYNSQHQILLPFFDTWLASNEMRLGVFLVDISWWCSLLETIIHIIQIDLKACPL